MSDLGNKKIMADNILYYMKLNNKTRQDLCNDLGFKYTTISGWITAEKYPRIDKIEKMANYFGISKANLVEKRQPKEPFQQKEHEQNLIKKYRCLSPQGKTTVDNLIDNLISVEKSSPDKAD